MCTVFLFGYSSKFSEVFNCTFKQVHLTLMIRNKWICISVYSVLKKSWHAHEVFSYIKVINKGIMYILHTAHDMKCKRKLLSALVEVAHDPIILLLQPTSHMVQVLRHLDTYKYTYL